MKRRMQEEDQPKETKIILLSEVIESKLRKEKELEYYQQELEKLQAKMGFIRREIDLTNLIIEMIDHEMVQEIEGTKQAALLNFIKD
jgi:hypothetical protein